MGHIATAFLIASAILLGGCMTPTPHESLDRALSKTFDENGYNFSSRIRIAHLSLPSAEQNATSSVRRLQQGINILRNAYLSADGAIDFEHSKAETTYGLHYHQNNVDLSVRLPVLADYEHQKLYLGKSFLHTILPLIDPNEPRLLLIDLNQSMEGTSAVPRAFSNVINAQSFQAVHEALRQGTTLAFHDLNATTLTYLPLNERDKEQNNAQRIGIELDENQSLYFLAKLVDSTASELYNGSLLTQGEYLLFHALSNPKRFESLEKLFSLKFSFDIGIDRNGRISRLDTIVYYHDRLGKLELSLESLGTFGHFGSPMFLIEPEHDGVVRFEDAMENNTVPIPSVEQIQPLENEINDLVDVLG